VEAIKAVLLEPVGCLAEFLPDEFNAAALQLRGGADAPATGSQAYWRLMGLLDQPYETFSADCRLLFEEFERRAVERADLYPDVRPALEALRQLGVATFLVTSLSRSAVHRFVQRFALADLFSGSVTRDEAGGVMGRPLHYAIEHAALDPRRTMVLVDTAPALDMAKPLGLNTMLMINDYDEGRALAERNPAGGIVSLAELADALRLIEQQSGMRHPPRPPLEPYELFEPS
jgi:phosphoglycolate phosphatase-like HAD superfamily hydrolase